MKNFFLALACFVAICGSGRGADIYWDPDGDPTGNNSATGENLGGAGTWDTSNNQWYNGTTNVAWTNGNTPVFWGPAGGTVTIPFGTSSPAVFQTRTVTGVTFKTDGYTIDGSGGNSVPTTGNTMGTLAFGSTNAVLTADPFVKGTIGARMTGSGGFIVDGGGTIRIDTYLNQNTTTGAVTVQNGSTLELAYSGAIGGTGAGSGNITLNNGTLRNTNNGAITTNNNTTFLTPNRGIILGPLGGTLEPQATGLYSGTISGNGATLTKTGSGELRMSGANQNHSFEKLVINGGTYSIGSGTTLGQDRQLGAVPANFMADQVTIDNNAVFRFLGALLPTDTVTLHANRGFTIGPGGAQLGTFTANGVIPGKITGPGGITKISTGFFLAISGVGNDYEGSTTINGGMLQVNSVAGTSTGSVFVNSTGILGGTGSVVGPVFLSNGAHVQAGAQNGNEDFEVPAIDLVPGSFIDTVLGPTVGSTHQSDVLRVLTPTTGLTLNGGGFGAFPALGVDPKGKMYTMIDYDTAFTEGSATLAQTLLNNGTGYEATVQNNVANTSIDLVVSDTVIDREWIQSGAGDWSFTAGQNWSNGSQANGPGSIARFLSATSGAVVTLNDTSKTVGTLILDNESPYTFQSTPATNRVLFNTYSGNAALTVVKGSHEFLSGITYMVPTVVTVPAETELKVASTGIDNTGSMTKMGEGTLTISTNWFGTGATNINEGTLKFAVSAAGLSENGPINIGAMGTLDMNGITDTFGSLAGAGNIVNGGNITLGGINSSSPVEFSGNYSGSNTTRTLTKNGASATQILSGTTGFTATTAAAGTLILNGTHAGTTSVSGGATLGGTGTLAGQMTVVANGTLAPGHDGIGTIHLQGATALSLTGGASTSSILRMELDTVGGMDVSDLIDAASSAVTIAAGTVPVRINLVNAGSMTGGTYTLIDYGTLAGTGGFAGLSLGTQPSGFLYKLVNNTANTTVDLLVGFAGDFNNDNVVDAADYTVWRKNNGLATGATFFQGDGDGDGDVDDADYAVWRSRFGSTIPGLGSGSGLEEGAVPEPTALGVLLILASAFGILRRSR